MFPGENILVFLVTFYDLLIFSSCAQEICQGAFIQKRNKISALSLYFAGAQSLLIICNVKIK